MNHTYTAMMLCLLCTLGFAVKMMSKPPIKGNAKRSMRYRAATVLLWIGLVFSLAYAIAVLIIDPDAPALVEINGQPEEGADDAGQ